MALRCLDLRMFIREQSLKSPRERRVGAPVHELQVQFISGAAAHHCILTFSGDPPHVLILLRPRGEVDPSLADTAE